MPASVFCGAGAGGERSVPATMILVLFDIDGTLLDARGAGREALLAALREECGGDLPPLEIRLAGGTDHGIVAELAAAIDLPPTEENLTRLLRRYLVHLPGHLESRRVTSLPGVQELLVRLETMPGVHTGLLTGNIEEGARAKIERSGIDHEFAFGGYGVHADRADVAAAALDAAEAHLGRRIPAERTLVVGDTINDIRCARAVGASVLAVETGFDSAEALRGAEPDHQMADLSDTAGVLAILERWLS